MPVLPETVTYHFPKHSKEDADTKLIFVSEENAKKIMLRSLRLDIRR